MTKVIVYFHGYNSGPESEKVFKLMKAFPDDAIYSFPINIDPEIAQKDLENNIDDLLIDHLNEDIKLIFVGTSLGGWWVSRLAKLYNCPGIIINPCYSPQKSLEKYGVSEDILKKYSSMKFYSDKDYYFIALHDEIIDPIVDYSWKNLKVYENESVKHRFNGPEFNDVIELIKKL